MNSRESLIEYLSSEGGKQSTDTWVDLAERFDIRDSKGNISGEAARQAWKAHRKNTNFMSKEITINTSVQNIPEDLKESLKDYGFNLNSVWTSGEKVQWSAKIDPSKEEELVALKTREEITKTLLDFDKKKVKTKKVPKKKVGVVTTADYHIGAEVEGLDLTQDFNLDILLGYIDRMVEEINAKEYSEVHFVMLGDMIESFTGLNHINSWKSLNKNLIGANAVITTYKVIHSMLSKINNLSQVYLIAGNHDRITSSNKEDTKGEVADLLAFFLGEKLNVPITYKSLVISTVIDNINYIFSHGNHAISSSNKIDTLLMEYSIPGHFIMSVKGHKHTRLVEKDSSKARSILCPPLFTGNTFSEQLGMSTVPGFLVMEQQNGYPRVEDIPLGVA